MKFLSVALLLGCTSSIAYADVRSHDTLNAEYSMEQLVPIELIPNVNKRPETPLLFAQNTEGVRIFQLEDQVRFLNGQVEEMQFQLLQMQEQLRKMQEDNEFRFQELEQSSLQGNENQKIASADTVKSADNAKNEEIRLGKSQPSDSSFEEGADGKNIDIIKLIEGSSAVEGSFSRKSEVKRTIDGVEIFDPNVDISADELGASANIRFGEFKFDGSGNVIADQNQKATGAPIQLGGPLNQPMRLGGGSAQPAEMMPTVPSELFDLGYQYVQAGQYEQSAKVFEEFANQHSTDRRLAAAQFWLGESYFSVGRYEDAAKIFLLNHKEHPEAKLGAQNLLKLGVSMAGLNQRELACATYAEVPKKYPQISQSVKKRILVEQKSAKCKN